MRQRCISVGILVTVMTVIGLTPRPAFPQGARGTLNVTIVDPSGAVIAGAAVIVAGTEDATKAATPAPAQTSSQGVATITGLAPGRYSVEGSFPGFETRFVKDVRVRAGENRQVLLLPIAGLKDSTFGFGADALLLDGRLRLSADLFGSFQRTPHRRIWPPSGQCRHS